MKTLPSLDLPNTHRFVERAGDYELRLGAEVDAEHEVRVSLQGHHVCRLAGGGACVPDAESAVVGGGADVVGVRGPSEVRYALGVADEAVEERVVLCGPYD